MNVNVESGDGYVKNEGTETLLFGDDGEAHSNGDPLTAGGWVIVGLNNIYTADQAYQGNLSLRTGYLYGLSYAEHSFTTPSINCSLHCYFYDNGTTAAYRVGRIRLDRDSAELASMGIWTYYSTVNYIVCDAVGCHDSGISRSVGWHEFEMIINADGSMDYYIDGSLSSWNQPPGSITDIPNKVRIQSNYHHPYFDVIQITTPAYHSTHDAASGYEKHDTVEEAIFGQDRPPLLVYIARGFLAFDTSGIPDGAVITSAYIRLYVSSIDNNVDPNDDLCVVQGSQDSVHSLVLSDYSKVGDVIGGSIAGGSVVEDWNDIILNEAGLSMINKGGYTKFGLISKKDVDASTPPKAKFFHFYCSEKTGFCPILHVEWGGAGASMASKLISAGLI